MEKLEKKIKHFLTGTENPLNLSEREKVMIKKFTEFHTEESKDIAIAFASWKDGLRFEHTHIVTRDGDNVNADKKSDTTLFTEFINQR